MNIKFRLTILFSFLSIAILAGVSFYIYQSYNEFRKEEFYKRLADKAYTTTKILTDIKQVDYNLLRVIDKNTLNALYDEKILVFDKNNKLIYSSIADSKINVNNNLLNKIRKEKYLEYRENEIEVVGIYFDDEDTHDVVIASAYDKFGYTKLDNLKYMIISGNLIGLVLIVIAGRIFVQQALSPIENINHSIAQITASRLQNHVDEGNGKDEIAQLAKNFNQMLSRLSHSFDLQKSFVQNASHEMRTPLATISSQLELALSKHRSVQEYQQTLKSVLDDTANLTNLVNTLLELAKAESGEWSVYKEKVQIDELLFLVERFLHAQHHDYKIRIDYEQIPENSEELQVPGNALLLQAVFQNLAENACKFSGNKTVNVQIDCNTEQIAMRFSDNGIGIASKDLERVFDPFYRAENAMSIRGSGIGLAICKKIIALHQGHIHASSSQGQGSTFTVLLPKNA